MTDFDILFQYILKVEGGYSNDRNDRGGETKYGVTYEVAKKYGYNVKDLTIIQAKEIYFTEYYKRHKVNFIHDVRKQIIVFDVVVNAGYNGSMLVQKALNKLNYKLKVDKLIGLNTLSALNDCKFEDFEYELSELQTKYYINIVERDRTQKIFLEGWLFRILRRYKYIKNLI